MHGAIKGEVRFGGVRRYGVRYVKVRIEKGAINVGCKKLRGDQNSLGFLQLMVDSLLGNFMSENQIIEYMIEVVVKYYDPNKIPVEVYEANLSDLIERDCINDIVIKILKERYQEGTTFVNIHG